MIKLICFDFDGVLLDLCETHKISLNKAIESICGKEFIISDEEHYSIYNGLSTKNKLNMLVANKNLPKDKLQIINLEKQKLTISAINETIVFNNKLLNDLTQLKSEGYILSCCSNAIYNTVETGLKKAKIFDLFSLILGNESVENQKPSPDIYIKAMDILKFSKEQTLILEDSMHGLEAAISSGAYTLKVSSDTKETTYENIKNKINNL